MELRFAALFRFAESVVTLRFAAEGFDCFTANGGRDATQSQVPLLLSIDRIRRRKSIVGHDLDGGDDCDCQNSCGPDIPFGMLPCVIFQGAERPTAH